MELGEDPSTVLAVLIKDGDMDPSTPLLPWEDMVRVARRAEVHWKTLRRRLHQLPVRAGSKKRIDEALRFFKLEHHVLSVAEKAPGEAKDAEPMVACG